MLLGRNVIEIGRTRIGQDYVLGARVPLDNPNWNGPWDCAEFTSWCAFQAYGLIFGAGNVKKVANAEPFSGHWFADAKKRGEVIRWQEALDIPGAFLIRAKSSKLIGHVAISMGDGERTLEARGKAFGVDIFGKAKARPWGIGCLLPGVDYENGTSLPGGGGTPGGSASGEEALPSSFIFLAEPNRKGPEIVAIQRALMADRVNPTRKGIDPGPIDGEFGPMSSAALITFQAREGLEVDGILGPVSAAALGLAFPVVPSAEDKAIWERLTNPAKPGPIINTSGGGAADTVASVELKAGIFEARTQGGARFLIGSRTTFTDDMHRTGLMQGSKAINDSRQFGTYKADDFVGAFDQWAHFIEPTLTAEGGGRFATLNTYDRAAFTFGAPQLAAHTPKRNFVVYLRELLKLPGAATHFPDLVLRPDATGAPSVHRVLGAGFDNLEEERLVTRPNGVKERQLPKLMAYLNTSPTAVDDAELFAAARLMNWLKADPRARTLQIEVFIGHAKDKFVETKKKVPAFTGNDWRLALWIMDILHQGRGSFREIAGALASAAPEERLKTIGASRFASRIETVADGVRRLAARGVMNGFTV